MIHHGSEEKTKAENPKTFNRSKQRKQREDKQRKTRLLLR
jgi:hypothetical protein